MAADVTNLLDYSNANSGNPKATPNQNDREDDTVKAYRNQLTKDGLADSTYDVLAARGYSSTTAEAVAFNRYNWIMPSDELGNVLSYVFIVRPDLNVINIDSGSDITLPDALNNDPFFVWLTKSCPSVLRNLSQSGAGFNHHFINFLVNRVESYQVSDWSVSYKEISMPFTNYKIQYAGNANESISSREFDIGFREDVNLRVTKLFTAWTKYINGVVMNHYETKHHYQQSRFIYGAPVLDYATSIYLIKTKADGSEIIYFHKTTGAFPANVPHNLWSYNKDGKVMDDNITINFYGGFPEPLNPETMNEFNYNAGFSHGSSVPNVAKNFEIAHWGSPIVGRPFIVCDNNGVYRLGWESLAGSL